MHTRMRFLLMICTAAAAVIAYVGLSEWAVVVTAVYAALTSWAEFTDTERKVERYTGVIVELKATHNWWKSLGEVEKASTERISTLVRRCEDAINAERSSWGSTDSQAGGDDESGGSKDSKDAKDAKDAGQKDRGDV